MEHIFSFNTQSDVQSDSSFPSLSFTQFDSDMAHNITPAHPETPLPSLTFAIKNITVPDSDSTTPDHNPSNSTSPDIIPVLKPERVRKLPAKFKDF